MPIDEQKDRNPLAALNPPNHTARERHRKTPELQLRTKCGAMPCHFGLHRMTRTRSKGRVKRSFPPGGMGGPPQGMIPP
jgi:hypothetical protein